MTTDSEKSVEQHMTNEALTPCSACKKSISVQAETCPSCGAPNDWLHPAIQRLVEQKDQLGKAFNFRYKRHEVWGGTERKVPIVINVICWTLFIGIFSVAYLFGAVGLAFGPIGLITTVILFVGYSCVVPFVFGKKQSFEANLLTKQWQSSDDDFWREVKTTLKL